MRVCLMIEGQESVTWEEWVDLAAAAEKYGFDALYRSDHYLSLFDPGARSSLDAWTTIAGLAPLTTRLRFGTLVSPVSFRHPSHLAKTVVSADHISGGRVEVGIGAGWYEAEHRSFGFGFSDDSDRFGALEEYMEIVNRLWSDEDGVTFSGQHFHLDGARAFPKPIQRPHPPVIMGGMAGPRAARLAARWASEYNLYDTASHQVKPKRDRLRSACEANGRDPDSLGISINGNVLIGTDRADLTRRAARHLAYQRLDLSPDEHLASLGDNRLVGTPTRILEQLGEYAAAGVSRMMMQVFPHNDLEAIGIIGTEVVPAASRI
jgi:F420-dependent oxidoreductase-like protein